MHPERDLVVPVAAARHHQGQVIEDSFAEAVHVSQAVGRRQFDSGLPFLSAPIVEPFRRDSDLHGTLLLIPILPASRGNG
jgi:hypothetical protein